MRRFSCRSRFSWSRSWPWSLSRWISSWFRFNCCSGETPSLKSGCSRAEDFEAWQGCGFQDQPRVLFCGFWFCGRVAGRDSSRRFCRPFPHTHLLQQVFLLRRPILSPPCEADRRKAARHHQEGAHHRGGAWRTLRRQKTTLISDLCCDALMGQRSLFVWWSDYMWLSEMMQSG